MESSEEFLDDLSDDSETNEQVQAEPVVCEMEEKHPKPEYSNDELNELLSVLKKIVYLDELTETDWNDECDEIIRQWFIDPKESMVTIYFSPSKKLTANLKYPTEPVFDLMYFIRDSNHIFTLDDFHDSVQFGRVDCDIDGSLLLLVEKVFAPFFINKPDSNDFNRIPFLKSLHIFLAKTTALHYQLSGLTVLYVPNEDLNERTMKDVQFIKRLEVVAEQWIKQIRNYLCEREQMVGNELVCPNDEYEFWVNRCENLLGLQYQVKHKDFLRIFGILEKFQSIFVKPLSELFVQIDKQIEQAQNNVRYLTLLLEPCEEISKAASPAAVPVKLPRIINIIRYIWLNAKYYNSPDSIMKLYRFVGNQIICFCQHKIQVSDIFKEDPSHLIKLANLSVDCCLYYKMIYGKIAQRHDDWTLDQSLIFNYIDSFVHRLQNLIEICAGIVTFGRKENKTDYVELKFGGDRGAEFQGTCKRIGEKFEHELKRLESFSHSILDIRDKKWNDAMKQFQELTGLLEDIAGNMLHNVFTCVENLDDGIYALACFHRYSNRNELRKKFEQKVIVVWKMLASELSTTNDQLVEEYDEYLSFLPPIAAQCNQLQINRQRIIRLRSLFESGNWLPESIDTETILTNYNTMIVKMQKSIQKSFDEWIQSLGVDVFAKLHRLVLKRSLKQKGLFECNIDLSIFIIFKEAHFFKLLGFGFPVHINQFFVRESAIRSTYDDVIDMILSYNRILLSLSDFERILLQPLIHTTDKYIAQGALRYTWAHDGLDTYINDCNKYIGDLKDVVNIYQQTNAQVVQCCKRICNIVIVGIPNDEPRQLDDVTKGIQNQIEQQVAQLNMEYKTICGVFNALREELSIDMECIQENWIEYILKFEELIEEAIKTSARKTLESVYDTLHGNGVLYPDVIFHVIIDIREFELIQYPSQEEIRSSFLNIFDLITKAILKLSRIVESFDHKSKDKLATYSDLLLKDSECLDWQSKIKDELELNQKKMEHYQEEWLQYAYVWQLNKPETIEKFAISELATAKGYDEKIIEQRMLSHKITLIDSTIKVHFMLVNATDIRKKIRIEIEEWKRLYLDALQTKTNEKLVKFHEYIDANGEQILEPPKTAIEELQKSCTPYEQLMSEIDRHKCTLNELNDQFDVLYKYGISIDNTINELRQTIQPRWEE